MMEQFYIFLMEDGRRLLMEVDDQGPFSNVWGLLQWRATLQ